MSSATHKALEAATEEMQEPAVVTGDDDRILYANGSFAQKVDLDPQELRGRALGELLPLEGLEHRRREVGDGQGACSLHVFRSPDRDVSGVVQGLIEGEDRHRLAFTWERDALSIIDADTGKFVEVNDAWVEQYGYSREEALAGMGPADVSAEPIDTQRAVTETARAGGRTLTERWHKHRDGRVFPVEVRCGTVEVGGRRLVYAALRDISDRVQAEEALRRSETSFRSLIESLPYGVLVVRGNQTVYVNPAFCDMLGYSAHELIGRPPLDMVHPDDAKMVGERARLVMQERTAVPLREERFVRSDGTPLTVESTVIPVDFGGDAAGLAILQDVRERKSMEAQLVTADRLAALGRLAAAIGHEINNPLAYVMGNVQLARRALSRLEDTQGAEAVEERLALAEEGASRVRNIVRDLRTLSRGGDDAELGPVEVQRLLDVCADMADPEIRYRARVVREYGEPLYALANEARLGQVFLNLLVNAGQAITEGRAEDNEVRVRTGHAEDGRVLVEISDTGDGIPEELEGRIFEPFVTSRHQGGGTGLGLSICHHIVTSLGGSIEFERKRPHGTRFRVYLPPARSDADSDAPETGSDVPSVRGGRVLVVDDEPQVARLLAMTLEGYEVEMAHSGREALLRLEKEDFDAVLCDLMMSDVGGIEVYEHLARAQPAMKDRIIFMTGGAFTPRAREFLDAVPNRCLDKPFDLDVALRAVHDVLGDPG